MVIGDGAFLYLVCSTSLDERICFFSGSLSLCLILSYCFFFNLYCILHSWLINRLAADVTFGAATIADMLIMMLWVLDG